MRMWIRGVDKVSIGLHCVAWYACRVLIFDLLAFGFPGFWKDNVYAGPASTVCDADEPVEYHSDGETTISCRVFALHDGAALIIQ